jgi:glyoxylase-like metal-dependent hydrolase (beta-lactamase superfamily II)
MQTLRIPVGPYQTNCYILYDHHEAWIIDPGFDGRSIAQQIKAKHLSIVAVLLTHAHWDHILGLPELIEAFGPLPVLIHPEEAAFLGPKGGRLLRQLATTIDPTWQSLPQAFWESIPEATHHLADKEMLPSCNLEVLYTPGHTSGSISFYQKEDSILFSGDTLFAESVGRTDLPNSLPDQIIPSIRNKLLVLPEETQVFPGHGSMTTIGREKRRNPWLIS